MPSIIMKAAKAAPVLPLLLNARAASAAEDNPKGSYATNTTAGFWGVEPDQVEKWQSLLGDPDATGRFTLAGFNTSQPWAEAEELDWTVKIAVKAGMTLPRFDEDDEDVKVVTGGMVWVEPPEGLVSGDDYAANDEWSPLAFVYESAALNGASADQPLTPFFHRDAGDDSPADGSCEGILPAECLEALEAVADGNPVKPDGSFPPVMDEEKCPGIGGASALDLGSPLRLTERDQDGAAMSHNEGWLVSFSSPEHGKANETDYAVHGSQYIPVLFQWLRTADEELGSDVERPDGKISSLLCVAVNEAADGKELPAPDDDYLEAVEEAEAGKFIYRFLSVNGSYNHGG